MSSKSDLVDSVEVTLCPSFPQFAHGNIFRGRGDGLVVMVVGICGDVMNFHNIFCGGEDGVFIEVVGVVGGGNVICVCNIICGRGDSVVVAVVGVGGGVVIN